MKKLIIFLLIFTSILSAKAINLKGKVVNSEDGSALYLANLLVQGTSYGVTTDADGSFELTAIPEESSIYVSYVGFKAKLITISEIDTNSDLVIELDPQVLTSQTVLVKATIGQEGKTPIAFAKIERKEIEDSYTYQDVPEYLSNLPSTTFYSEGGSGIGYNYLSIRGFDQRRISVSYNGIPQNDPEDHNIYWHNISHLLGNAGLIQVQRGAGSGVSGYPAIGGSINIITSPFSDKPMFDIGASIGSYNTRKYNASFASGLINDKYSVYVNLSQTLSSGYRDMSWVNFKSFYISAVRYDENVTTQINVYGGPITDGLVYNGLPKDVMDNKELRKKNYSYWEWDKENQLFQSWSTERRASEIEEFSQPHFELLNEVKLSKDVTLNSALFLVLGNGFFDYDGAWSVYYDDYFRLHSIVDSSEFKEPQNALIRAQVENKMWGWIPRLSWNHKNGTFIAGIDYRNHNSVHWGRIQYAQDIPVGVPEDHQYYYYEGGKDIFNAFVHENYQVNSQLSLLGEIQLAYHKYSFCNEKYVGTEFDVSDLFINPRIGVNYKFTEETSAYLSYAKVSREPRLKNYYDAAESSAGEVPQFELNANGTYNFDNPLVKPETMNSFDLGSTYRTNKMILNLNLFYMMFSDEIVKKGSVDRFGQPITGNVDKTIHSGIEISGTFRMAKGFELILNGTYSQNYISEGSTYLGYGDGTVELDLKDNSISGFPDVVFNAILKYQGYGLTTYLTGKYVGDFYTDNYGDNFDSYQNKYPGIFDYDDNKVDAYFVTNFLASYEFELQPVFSRLKVFVQVNNLFDNLYASYGIGKEFFPSAERYFLTGIQLGL